MKKDNSKQGNTSKDCDHEIVVEQPNIAKQLDANKKLENDQASKELAENGAGSKKGDALQKELNGPKGLEPTRYGDWESKGRCYDF